MEAISNAGAAIGMLAKDGVVLIAEKKVISKVCELVWELANMTFDPLPSPPEIDALTEICLSNERSLLHETT